MIDRAWRCGQNATATGGLVQRTLVLMVVDVETMHIPLRLYEKCPNSASRSPPPPNGLCYHDQSLLLHRTPRSVGRPTPLCVHFHHADIPLLVIMTTAINPSAAAATNTTYNSIMLLPPYMMIFFFSELSLFSFCLCLLDLSLGGGFGVGEGFAIGRGAAESWDAA